MRLYELLKEGYKDAQAEFASASDPNIAAQIINAYKQLVTKNQVKGNERNIDWWRKQGWDKFKEFVLAKSEEPTKSDVKKKRLVGKSTTIQEDDNWLVVVPLDKDASCFHGKNSDWCTTKQFQNHYEKYFYKNNIVLIYCLNKQTGGMWAVAFHKDTDQIELFDQQDNSLTADEFSKQTGLDPYDLKNRTLGDEHDTKITKSRNNYNDIIKQIDNMSMYLSYNERTPAIEKLLVYTKDPKRCAQYISFVTQTSGDKIEFPQEISMAAMQRAPALLDVIKNPTEQVKIAAIKSDSRLIRDMENPTEKMQIAAVEESPDAIQYINNPCEGAQLAALKKDYRAMFSIEYPTPAAKALAVELHGFGHYDKDSTDGDKINAIIYSSWPFRFMLNPSEKVQIAAVNHDYNNLRHIDNPSDKVMEYALNDSANAIKYIKNPTKEMQIRAVTRVPGTIKYIKNPCKEVQVIYVEYDPDDIRHLYNQGVNPDEAVQLAAVRLEGKSIKWIPDPSEQVQLEAVNENPLAIKYISEPTLKVQLKAVTLVPLMIKRIESPSEQVQLAAISGDPNVLQFIQNPTERVTALAAKMKEKKLTTDDKS